MEFFTTLLLILFIVLIIIESFSYRNFIRAADKFNETSASFVDAFNAVGKDIIAFNSRLNEVENIQEAFHSKIQSLIRDNAELQLYNNLLMSIANIDKNLLLKAADFSEISPKDES